MSLPMSAPEVLEREFLEMRAKCLELAASFDRLERADGSVSDEQRFADLKAALEVLLSKGDNRAERIQKLFSRPYQADWQETFQLEPRVTNTSDAS